MERRMARFASSPGRWCSTDQGGSVEALIRRQIINRAEHDLSSVEEATFSEPRDGKVHHGLGGIDRCEAPVRLQRSGGHDLLRTPACSGDQNLCRRPAAKGCGQHASGKLVAGVVARQRDAALRLILASPRGIELAYGIG